MRPVALLVAASLTAMVAAPALAAPIHIAHAWARPAAAGATGAAYLVVENTSAETDRLVSASTRRAASMTLHHSEMHGSGMGAAMVMREADGLDVPARGAATLAPGGWHFMLEGLHGSLKPGETVPATLVFRRAGRIEVSIPVRTTAP